MSNVKIIAGEEIIRDQRVMKEARYISSLGYKVEILCWDRNNEFKDKEIEYIDNIKIKRFFPKAIYGSGWKQIFPFFKFIQECKMYLKNQKYEYLHCQNLDGFLAGYLVNNNKKLIFDMREFYVGRERNKIKKVIVKYLVRFAVKKSYRILYVNDTQMKNISNKERNKMIYLPNYPNRSLGIVKSISNINSNHLNISYIGGVRQYHEFKNLFDATKEIENTIINIHGMGTSYTQLKKIESEYKNVNITGKYNPSQTADLYNEADLIYCVYSMDNENWRTAYPIKFYESIITKTPVIVSKGSILEEFLEKNNIGFVVDGSDITEIKKLVTYISRNRNILEEKIKNLEKIQFDYCWEEVVKNLDELY